jgi:uncharacterized protein YjbJ (UPF0337 family)
MNVSMHDVPPRSRARSFVLGSQRKEIKMKKSAEDRTEGAARQVSGKIKQETGRITRNRSLQAKGVVEKNVGKVQRAAGRANARRSR